MFDEVFDLIDESPFGQSTSMFTGRVVYRTNVQQAFNDIQRVETSQSSGEFLDKNRTIAKEIRNINNISSSKDNIKTIVGSGRSKLFNVKPKYRQSSHMTSKYM